MKLDVDCSNFPEPADGPFLFVSNHQSMFDMPLIYSLLSKHYPTFVSKKELGKNYPSISYGLRALGSCLIDRKNAKQSISLLKKHSEKGISTIVFPEGTRAPEGSLIKYRRSGIETLLETGELKTVAVLMLGQGRILRKTGQAVERNVKVQVAFSEPISGNEVTAQCEKWAKEKLAELASN